jgi:GntR family transcriptional repressor for pyruvate dehydrogenase complex
MVMESLFEPIERKILSERIAAMILSLIKDRQLQSGDRLPPERELAKLLGVSRPPLREALRALSMMNILEIRQGSGTYIATLEPELLVQHLDLIFALEDTTYLELLRARRVLEGGLAEMAAQNITDAEIQDLRECLAKSIRSIDQPMAFLKSDLELHRIVCEAARNLILSKLMTSISKPGIHSRYRTTEIRDVRIQTVKDHEEIVAAISLRDAERSREAMANHLRNIERTFIENIASGTS